MHYGLKAVYALHLVFIHRKWLTQYLAAIFNNGRNGASGHARMSVFSDERQHNFLRVATSATRSRPLQVKAVKTSQ
jgi:hypothetical protein